VSGPPEALDARLAAVERALAQLDGRLRVLESGSPPELSAQVSADLPLPVGHGSPTRDVTGGLTLIGRTVVVLAGAYLLRGLTESGILDRPVGALLGWSYAVGWSVLAYRVAPRHPLSATFHGAATVIVAMPIVWEATTRLALMAPETGAVALALTTALVLVTAWRRSLHALAWIATIAACVVASVLLVMTGAVVAFSALLIVLGVATLWLGYDREWTLLRWVAALFADVAVLGLMTRALATPPRDHPSTVMAVQMLLLGGYLGSVGIRTLVRDRDVIAFEIVQTGAILLVGLGGALLVAHQTGVGAVALGWSLLILATGCYAVEFIDRRQTRGANRYFYTSLALVFALMGAELLLGGTALSVMWLMLALLAGWSAHHFERDTLAVHAVVYLAAAAIASGLVMTTFVGLFTSGDAAWRPVQPAAWMVLVAFSIYWLATMQPHAAASRAVTGALRLVLTVCVVVSVAGVLVVTAHTLLTWRGITPGPAGVVATVRTGVLALAALAVAWLGSRIDTRACGVLLYPLLGWGALKLLIEDFRTSPPLLLVVAFAFYGGALIIGPRIAHPRTRSA
jgi:hypothetical protein